MSTTTSVRRRVFADSPFDFVESRQVLRQAVRIEHALERSGEALLTGRVGSERYREIMTRLRRAVDELADVSRELTESVE